MYFDTRPKTRRNDLFDREDELNQFMDALQYSPLIVVTGLRRSGKTSFVNVALAESKLPHINVDLRKMPLNPPRALLVQEIQNSFNAIQGPWRSRIKDVLKSVRGVKIVGTEISLNWGKQGIELPEMFEKINLWAMKQKTKFIVAFDELQLIRGDKTILRLLAYIMDRLEYMTIVVTGSEVGLLYDFLNLDSTESELYGRHYTEIRMRNFTTEDSKSFLTKGFRQINIAIPEETLTYAVEKLDGIVGWLTNFGAQCRNHGKVNNAIVEEIMKSSGALARKEVAKLVSHSKRYGVILNFLSNMNRASWSQIKRILEAHEGRLLPNPAVSELLKRLVKMNIIRREQGKYCIRDPLLRHGIQQKPLPEQ